MKHIINLWALIHQRYNKLRNNNPPTTDPVKQAIIEKRNEEYTSRRNKFKSISCMRSKRIIDPILYQPAFSRDRYRLVKWRMHWLPSYPLKECRCGYKEARESILPIAFSYSLSSRIC